MINVISAIAMFCSLYGNYLVVKKKIIGFHIWILSNILWIVVNIIGAFNLSQVIMFIVYAILNFYGIYEWKHKNAQ